MSPRVKVTESHSGHGHHYKPDRVPEINEILMSVLTQCFNIKRKLTCSDCDSHHEHNQTETENQKAHWLVFNETLYREEMRGRTDCWIFLLSCDLCFIGCPFWDWGGCSQEKVNTQQHEKGKNSRNWVNDQAWRVSSHCEVLIKAWNWMN